MVTHKLEQAEKKNQELHAALEAEKKKNEALHQEIVKEDTAALERGRRANMQGLLLQLESMGEVDGHRGGGFRRAPDLSLFHGCC